MIQTFDRLTSLPDTMTLAQTCSRDGQGYVVILYCPLLDFSDPTKNVKEKEIKRQTLLEVVDYVATANTKFSENAIQKAVRMVSANVFRTLRLIASPETETKLIVFVLPFLLHPSKTIIQTSSGLFIIQSLHEYRALHRCMHEA
ncbi:unnamed protein product [Brassica rapa subsp. trilocularis]